jgi:hypothetical protein
MLYGKWKWIKTNTADFEVTLLGSVETSINCLKCLGKCKKTAVLHLYELQYAF